MKKTLLCSLFILLLVNCASTVAINPHREFYYDAFFDPVSKNTSDYKEIVIDNVLTLKNGEDIHFTNCLQIDSTDEESILMSQFYLLRLMKLRCSAIKLYLEKGIQAKKSFFPKKLTKELIMRFPATAGPIVSKFSLDDRKDKIMEEYEKIINISIKDDNTADVLTRTDEIEFRILARADFNNDGIEDLLVTNFWHIRNAFGKGSELFILEKRSATEPISLTWRYTKV